MIVQFYHQDLVRIIGTSSRNTVNLNFVLRSYVSSFQFTDTVAHISLLANLSSSQWNKAKETYKFKQ